MGYFGMSRFFLVISPNSGSFHYTEFLSFKVNSVYHWIILAYFTTTWSTIKEYSERAKIAALNCWRTCSHKTGEGQGPHTLRPKMDISVQAVLSLFIFLSLSSSWEDDEAKLFPLQPETQHELFLYQARAAKQDLMCAWSMHCSHPNPHGVNSILPKVSPVTDSGEVQDLGCHLSKSCQHLLLWAHTLNLVVFSVFIRWVVKGHPGSHRLCPLCLPEPQHHFSADPEAQQLIWVWQHPHWGPRGALESWSPSWRSPWHRAGEGQGCAKSPSLVHPHSCPQK